MDLEDLIRQTKPNYITVDTEKLTDNVFAAIREHQRDVTQADSRVRFTRKRKITIGSAVLAAGAAFTSGFVSPSVAAVEKSIPVIGAVFNLLQSSSFAPPHNIQYATSHGFNMVVNQSSTDHGITLTIRNAYCDMNEFAFDMVESFDKNIQPRPIINDNDFQLTIDGNRKLYNIDGGDFKRMNDGRYGGIVHFLTFNDSPYQSLPEQFELHVHIDHIGQIKGNWNFTIPFSRMGTSQATKVCHPAATSTLGGITLTVIKISASPSQIEITYELRQPITIEGSTVPHLTEIAVYDQSGNRLAGGIVRISKAHREGNNEVIEITADYTSPSVKLHSLRIEPDAGLTGLSIYVPLT